MDLFWPRIFCKGQRPIDLPVCGYFSPTANPISLSSCPNKALSVRASIIPYLIIYEQVSRIVSFLIHRTPQQRMLWNTSLCLQRQRGCYRPGYRPQAARRRTPPNNKQWKSACRVHRTKNNPSARYIQQVRSMGIENRNHGKMSNFY